MFSVTVQRKGGFVLMAIATGAMEEITVDLTPAQAHTLAGMLTRMAGQTAAPE